MNMAANRHEARQPFAVEGEIPAAIGVVGGKHNAPCPGARGALLVGDDLLHECAQLLLCVCGEAPDGQLGSERAVRGEQAI